LRISARQHASLNEDLEAVANAQDFDALFGLFADCLENRHAGCNRAAAEIIAVRETAWDDDEVNVWNFGFSLPNSDRLFAGNLGQGRDHVAISV
jgi:hypothetical protein